MMPLRWLITVYVAMGAFGMFGLATNGDLLTAAAVGLAAGAVAFAIAGRVTIMKRLKL